MLESNSDRLYWVIGAIVLGAVLVAVVMKFMPGILKGKVSNSIDKLFDFNTEGSEKFKGSNS